MRVDKLPQTLRELLGPEEWHVKEDHFDRDKINFYETIFTVGNGYLGTRGAIEGYHTAAFPETFLNGIFDHNDSAITHIVNSPNWLPFHIYANNERLCIQNCKMIGYYRILDLKQGLLYRFTRFQDPKGNITRYESIRYANFADKHCCEIKVIITPENYSGEILIDSEIEGHTFNLDLIPAYENRHFDPEVKWEKWAKSKHLGHVITKVIDKNNLYLEMKTLDRPHVIGYASSIKMLNSKAVINKMCDYERTHHVVTVNVKKGQPLHLEKLVTIFTSRDVEKENVEKRCAETLYQNLEKGFSKRFAEHKKVWDEKWKHSDCVIIGDERANLALRFCMFHLLIAANEHDPRVNIGAKTLSGEGYKGHIFWDTEIFALPFFIYTQPKTAKSLLMYRYHTLKTAKENAELTGYKGARYPWESADHGHEETPKWSADGKNRIWPGEEEIHITADIVHGIMTYFIATNDVEFMLHHGIQIIFETARFWASRLEHNEQHDRYELSSVIGPDEYHEHVNNNVFTNWMAKWNLLKAAEIYHWMNSQHQESFEKINRSLKITSEEIDVWQDIAKKVYILYDPETKLFEEFENYYQLRDVPITERDDQNMPIYPEGFDDFNTGGTMLVKQADVIALLYILTDEFGDEIKKINYDYYEPKTMHASSLSASIHAIMAIETRNTNKAMQYFEYTSCIDLEDHKGSTESGIHMAACGGTWQAVVCGFGGLRVKNHKLTFKPWMPKNWQEIRFTLKWRGDDIYVKVRQSTIELLWESDAAEPMDIEVADKNLVLKAKQPLKVKFTPEEEQIEIKHSEIEHS